MTGATRNVKSSNHDKKTSSLRRHGVWDECLPNTRAPNRVLLDRMGQKGENGQEELHGKCRHPPSAIGRAG